MKTVAISEFKAHILRMVDQVAKRRETILVTRYGKPLAEIRPYNIVRQSPGKLAGTFIFEKNLITPFGGEIWNVSR